LRARPLSLADALAGDFLAAVREEAARDEEVRDGVVRDDVVRDERAVDLADGRLEVPDVLGGIVPPAVGEALIPTGQQ
jgi:hypothetical protein